MNRQSSYDLFMNRVPLNRQTDRVPELNRQSFHWFPKCRQGTVPYINNVPRKTNSNDSVPEIRTTNNKMLPETITGVSKLEQHISKCLPKRRQGSRNYNTDINMFLDTKTVFPKLENSISICFSNRFVNSTVSIEKKVFISNNKCNYCMTDNSLVGKPKDKR